MNLTPVQDLTKLNAAALIKEADEIIDSMESWQNTSNHNYNLKNGSVFVPIYKKTLNNESWCGRVSDFKEFDASFRKRYYHNFVKYIIGSLSDLTKTHTEYETKYVHEIYEYRISPVNLEGAQPDTLSYVLEAYYKFQFPLKRRVFYELIIVHKPQPVAGIQSGFVVSLPIDPKLFKNARPNDYVIAKYTSIEKFTFNPETSALKWSMCTSSTPGGYVPNWMVEMSIGGAVAKDVPGFINFCEK